MWGPVHGVTPDTDSVRGTDHPRPLMGVSRGMQKDGPLDQPLQLLSLLQGSSQG